MNFENRFKDFIGFSQGDFWWWNNGDLAFYALIYHKIGRGQFAYEFDKYINIHIVKINGYELLRLFLRIAGLCQAEMTGLQNHHDRYYEAQIKIGLRIVAD